MTWKDSKLYAEERGGSLYGLEEIRKILAYRASMSYYDLEFFQNNRYESYVPIVSGDAWLAVVGGDNNSGYNRDWV